MTVLVQHVHYELQSLYKSMHVSYLECIEDNNVHGACIDFEAHNAHVVLVLSCVSPPKGDTNTESRSRYLSTKYK